MTPFQVVLGASLPEGAGAQPDGISDGVEDMVFTHHPDGSYTVDQCPDAILVSWHLLGQSLGESSESSGLPMRIADGETIRIDTRNHRAWYKFARRGNGVSRFEIVKGL